MGRPAATRVEQATRSFIAAGRAAAEVHPPASTKIPAAMTHPRQRPRVEPRR
jgi:hypothetical protein